MSFSYLYAAEQNRIFTELLFRVTHVEHKRNVYIKLYKKFYTVLSHIKNLLFTNL